MPDIMLGFHHAVNHTNGSFISLGSKIAGDNFKHNDDF